LAGAKGVDTAIGRDMMCVPSEPGRDNERVITMPDPKVTIRHARHAIHMAVSGALRDIEHMYPDDGTGAEEMNEDTRLLFDNCIDELAEWEIEGTWADRAYAIIAEMTAMLSNDDCPTVIRELLTKHNLLP
jgi:hypothetical protein